MMADPDVATSSSDTSHSNSAEMIAEQEVPVKIQTETDEPEAKKRKVDKLPVKPDKLEQRLGGILCCAVCLDLPRSAVYQVSNNYITNTSVKPYAHAQHT